MAECGITGKKAKTLKDSQFKHVAAIIFIITLVSASLLPFVWDVEAEEPTIPTSSTGIFTATWTFDSPEFFNTTETTIDDSKVFLQYHNYQWNQTSTDDFDAGEMNNVTSSVGEVELDTEELTIGNSTTTDIPQNANWTFIDLNNPANYDGILTKWTVNVWTDGRGKMKIFRENEDKTEFILVDETQYENVFSNSTNTFDCYIEIEQGDYIGWYSNSSEIWASTTSGEAYTMQGDVFETHPKSNWTSDSLILPINASGIFRYPVGTLTSQVFNASSTALWEEIRWGEDLSSTDVDIVVQTRTGDSSDTAHNSWSSWSNELTNSTVSAINNPKATYIQFLATLTATQQPYTPTLFDVSISYSRYSSYGEIETRDLIPGDLDPEDLIPGTEMANWFLVKWLEFSTDVDPNGQYMEYYSLDSGDTWQSVPDNGDLSSVSVFGGKIRFKVSLSIADTTITPVLSEMSLTYSFATPDMGLFLEADTNTAKPGERITLFVYYDNRGIGDAKGVNITLEMGANLIFKREYSVVASTIEEGNVRKWQFDTITPVNQTIIVDVEVRDVAEDITISTNAFLNYTDSGGNRYEGVISNTLTIEVTLEQDPLTYYLVLGLIMAFILVSFVLLMVRRRRADEDGEEKLDIKDMEKGRGYVIMEENPHLSYSLFSDLIDHGSNGLCITREFPGRVRTRYTFEGVSILWLSRAGDNDSILPTNLGGVLLHAKDFMDNNEESVILFDGLEYLIVHNGFEKVLKLVHGLNELTAINDAMLIIPLVSQTLDAEKIALLKRDLKMLT